MVRRPLGGAAGLLLATALTLTGCGAGPQSAQGVTDNEGTAVTPIQDRPSLEAVRAEFTEAEGRVKDAVAQILPGAGWRLAYEHTTGPCRENDGRDDPRAERLVGGKWELRAVPTEEQWAQIRGRVTEIVAEYGFVGTLMDTPVPDGNAYKVAGRYEGSNFTIAYRKAMVMGFTSGCHIPEE